MDREGSFAPSELDCFRVLSYGLRRGLRSFAAPRLGLSPHFSARLCGLRLGFCFSLDYGFCRLAGEGARAPGFDGGAEFGVFDRVLAGVVGDFAHHRLLADPVMDVAAIGRG